MSHTRRGMALVAVLLLSTVWIFAQDKPAGPSFSALHWVNYWSHLPVSLFGPEEEAFNKSMEVILFPRNDHDDPSNPNALDSNAQWLKDHPNVGFYLDGYASSRGGLIYNLALAQRRADWAQQALIMRGVARIVSRML